MRLVQSVRSGDLRLERTPAPTPGPTQVLVRTRASLISAGTEKSLRSLASASLLAKAKARPDLVRQVIDRARTSGLRSTVEAVRSRLSEDMPLGYSAAGEIVAVGEAVDGFRPGQRVATAGAPHADLQVVPGNLVVTLPDQMSFEDAAFATVGSIALNGLRLAEIGPGSKVIVVGLGLVGQLASRLAVAAGALVAGVEPDAWKRARAEAAGVVVFPADNTGWAAVSSWSGRDGADAALVTAATRSSEPIARSAEAVREKAVVVVVGDVGMELDRRPFYERELTLRVARSYGPGRYDPYYEELGVDYPIGQVRWTAQRNMQAFVELVASGRVVVSDLTTHRYPFIEAPSAYAMLESGDEPYIGIILEYEPENTAPAVVEHDPAPSKRSPTGMESGLIGAGQFAGRILVPAAARAGFEWRMVCSATGVGAQRVADDLPSARATAHPDDIIADSAIPIVFVASRHDSHAQFVIESLDAGKHVFCEKPLALTEAELVDIEAAWAASAGTLMVGFNRRWSPAVRDAMDLIDGTAPLQIIYRVNAGELPDDHWLLDRRMGGRLLGEACHFVDTCNVIVGSDPNAVSTITSGRGELLLDDNFTLLLGYPDGSQASIVYASTSSTRPGKERIEVLGRAWSIVIEDFGRLRADGPGGTSTERYRPADKGHDRELDVFADVVRGTHESGPVATSAFRTSRAMFAAVESAMTGTTVVPRY